MKTSKDQIILDVNQSEKIFKLINDILTEDNDNIILYSHIMPNHSFKLCYFEPDITDNKGKPIELQKLLEIKENQYLDQNIDLISSIEVDPEFQIFFTESDENMIKNNLNSIMNDVKKNQKQISSISLKEHIDFHSLSISDAIILLNKTKILFIDPKIE